MSIVTGPAQMQKERGDGDALLLSACAVAFLTSAAVTVYSCSGASCCTSVQMPGGWTMSKIWLPSPDHGWAGSFAMFLLMWIVMMLAMMLPSLTPVLLRFNRNGASPADVGRVAGAYFLVWTIFGAIAYPIGAALGSIAMHQERLSRGVPFLTGAALLLAGLVQWTPWKARHLECCRGAPSCEVTHSRGAWQAGWKLGVHCAECCLAIMTFMLVAGAMELRVMLLTTAILTPERVLPRSMLVARMVGAAMVLGGTYMLLHPRG